MSFEILPAGGLPNALVAPAGTNMVFAQSTAPNGWSINSAAAFNDASMRLNSGTGGTTGGATAWSSWNFGGSFGVNAFSLSVAQLAAHSHADSGHTHGYTDPAHTHGASDGGAILTNHNSGGADLTPIANGNGQHFSIANIATSFTGITINSSTANLLNNGSGAAITPTYTTPQVKFVDFIMCTKL